MGSGSLGRIVAVHFQACGFHSHCKRYLCGVGMFPLHSERDPGKPGSLNCLQFVSAWCDMVFNLGCLLGQETLYCTREAEQQDRQWPGAPRWAAKYIIHCNEKSTLSMCSFFTKVITKVLCLLCFILFVDIIHLYFTVKLILPYQGGGVGGAL